MESSWQGLHISAKYYPKLLIKCATIICSHSPARTESDPHRDNSNLSSGQASDQDLLSVIRLSCVPTVPFFHCWCYWSPGPGHSLGIMSWPRGGEARASVVTISRIIVWRSHISHPQICDPGPEKSSESTQHSLVIRVTRSELEGERGRN